MPFELSGIATKDLAIAKDKTPGSESEGFHE